MKGLGVVKLVDTLLGEESSEEEERSGAERGDRRKGLEEVVVNHSVSSLRSSSSPPLSPPSHSPPPHLTLEFAEAILLDGIDEEGHNHRDRLPDYDRKRDG